MSTYKYDDEYRLRLCVLLVSANGRYPERLHALLAAIADSYSDDPGTSDLYDEQPVTARLTLGQVRLARNLLR